MPAFPSGPWKGYYNYRGGGRQHWMGLSLTFAQGRVTGTGSDDIGRFAVSGGYHEESGECFWHKTYAGAHTVYYRGFREDKGIWGTWEIRAATGGFHIWPLGEKMGEEVETEFEEPMPVRVVAPMPAQPGIGQP